MGCRSHEQVVRDNGTISTDNGGSCSTNVCNCETDCRPEPTAITTAVDCAVPFIATGGILALVTLMTVVVGWIVSCVYFQRKINK